VPQKITTSSKSLVEAAKKQIEEITAADAIKLAGRDDVVLVDIRDPRRAGAGRQGAGRLPHDARHAGVLDRPRQRLLQADLRPGQEIRVLLCRRHAFVLATKTAQDMGLKPVAHIIGGFKAWKEAGGPVELVAPKK
jgi:rhodanese-related sulfurtransferase